MTANMDDKLEEIHEELLGWAESIGVETNNIRPMRLSGRGFGIVATDNIPEDTEILTVPISALRTKDTVPSTISKALPKDSTIHGLLAADMALNHPQNTNEYAKWNAVVPSREDIQLSMPLTWPDALQSRLPTASKKHLDKQRKKFNKDWGVVSATFPLSTSSKATANSSGSNGEIGTSCTWDEYLYAWLLVNTRTFYFVTPKTEKLPKEDHMILQPVADLFNHTDKGGCHVAFHHKDNFSFRTTRPYEKGDEVHISYGSHSNDFLLVEYGFVLPQNVWDEVCLDDALLPSLSEKQKEDLDEVGFLGNYVLDRDTVCHRTQVAMRLLLTDLSHGLSTDEWRRFVNGLDDGDKSQRKVDRLLVALLKDYVSHIAEKKKEIEELVFEDGTETLNDSRRELLLKRWEQISTLVSETIERLK